MDTKDNRITVEEMIDWEMGTMSDEDEVLFFQKLINNGMAWTLDSHHLLQGCYGRRATDLIKEGKCAYWQGGEV